MARTALDLTPEEWRIYKPSQGFQTLSRQLGPGIEARRESALELAHAAAKVLREKYAARKVLLFGSLAHDERFHLYSDIDIAVSGVKPENFYEAVAAVTSLSSFFKIDLVDLKDCRPLFKKVIETQGVEI